MLLILFVICNLFELMQEYVLKVKFVSNVSIFCVGTVQVSAHVEWNCLPEFSI